MWLPRPVYESIPYAYVAVGAICLGTACFVERAPRGLLLAAGGVLATLGLVFWMKRRDYRSTQAGYDPRALEEQDSASRSSS